MEPVFANDEARVEHVRRAVTGAGEALLRRRPWLRHQDALGLAIQLGALAGMAACAWGWVQGVLPTWATVPLVAVFASLTHEIEHDLIHRMYFRRRPLLHNTLLALGWLARPSTINPWIRRRLHLHHHKHSGTPSDIEERGITNGERWGLRRLLMVGDGFLAILLRLPARPDWPSRLRALARALAAYFPLGWVNWGLWWWFLGFHAVSGAAALAGRPVAWSSETLSAMDTVNALVVCWVGPNVLRSFCLHFVSSNMHYYGDVEDRNVFQQTQVLNHPLFWPFQWFCFNFGATHAIHHFVVPQPFYLRQAIAGEAHRAMREAGVRFNDLGTFRRANRRGAAPA